MKFFKCLFLIALILLSATVPTRAESTSLAEFREADRAFSRGDFQKAAALFSGIAQRSRASLDLRSLAQALEGLAAVYLSESNDGAFRGTMNEINTIKRGLAASGRASENLLCDGGFEEGLVPPWGTGNYEMGNFNFGIFWNSSNCRSFAKIETAVVHSGERSLRITNFSSPQPHFFGTTAQRVRNIIPNTVYEISLWAKAEGLDNGAVGIALDPGWNVRPIALPGGTWDWKKFTVQVNSQDLNFIDFRIIHQARGSVWFDDISLRKLESGEAPGDPLTEADYFCRRGEILKALKSYHDLEAAADGARLAAIRERLGQAYFALGEYGRAMDYFQKLQAPNNNRIAFTMGDIYLNIGQPDRALACYRGIYERTKYDQATQAFASDRMAMAYLRQGDLKEAATQEMEALSTFAHINDPHGRAMAYLHLGQIHMKKGEGGRAREFFNEALQLSRATGDRKLEGDSLQNLAMLDGNEDHLQVALGNLGEALKIRRQIHDSYGLIYSLYWQGFFQRKSNDEEGAIASLKESISTLEGVRDHMGAIDKGGDSLIAGNEVIYEEIISLLIKRGKIEEALEYLNRSRSEQLKRLFESDEGSLKGKGSQQAYQKAQNMLAEQEALEKILQNEYAKNATDQDASLIKDVDQQRQERQSEYREFVRTILKDQPELAGLISINPKNLKHKQKSLPSGAALVEYLAGEKQLYIFLVTSETLTVRMVKYPCKTLREDIIALRKMILTSAGSGSGPDKSFLALSHELHKILISPIEKELAGIKTLILIPNGVLHYLPFQLLSSSASSPQFLIDNFSFVYLCEESMMTTGGPPVSGRGEKFLLLGNPDGSLAYAEKEVRKIQEIYPLSVTFMGDRARKSLIMSLDRGYRGVHIASHGVFKSDDVKNSYIIMAPEPAGSTSGRLSLREIWGLDLEGLDIVTLSACNTAIGEVNPGDEVISLENAFIFAGASCVIATLWSVGDESTCLLMEKFYANLKTMNKADALRKAQVEVKGRYPQPFFWAPFILVGNWE